MNKKWLQKAACIVVAICMMQICTACNETEDTSSSRVKSNGGFKIYRLESDYLMEEALRRFIYIYPTMVIDDNKIADPIEFSNKMNTELMAGEGPDVIKADPSIFNSFHKTLNSGIFSDISSFMKNDSDFTPSVYNKTVLDSGIVDGKQLYIPISYKLPCIWTTKSISEEAGLSSIIDNWTWQQFLETGKSFTEGSQNRQKRYLFSYQYYNTLKKIYSESEALGDYGEKQSYYGVFYSMLLSSGTEFVDYKKKQSHFDSLQFISLLETLKELNDHSTPDKVLKSYKKAYYTQLKEKSLLAVCDGEGELLNHGLLNTNFSFMEDPMKEELAIYPFPTYSEDNKVMAEPLSIAAINNNSKNKEAAYTFIKKLLSNEIQKKITIGIPINNAMFDLSDFITSPLYAPMLEEAKKIANNIGGCSIMDQGVLTFVMESVDSFIKGDITAKQAAEIIDNKVILFLSE